MIADLVNLAEAEQHQKPDLTTSNPTHFIVPTMDRLSSISLGSAGAFSTASQIATRIVREDARMALEGGVEAVANAVKVTLGPKGRYVPG